MTNPRKPEYAEKVKGYWVGVDAYILCSTSVYVRAKSPKAAEKRAVIEVAKLGRGKEWKPVEPIPSGLPESVSVSSVDEEQ